ncbi:colon cancer-associated Mic1-like protein (macronuclear) [Tetrahymena thermophila SB210]|uniref:Colon cancer-associated Mic1-like protein n=1 Tax=Tetrahymena thermophila (strain SB210) TaxID=312017 RepID=Q22GI5_TETTS|nr:colon cancer-associated Mic1-like protein [Tetrahymena thermophila SB210]EAR84346.2 colon cancer-associated Mic1-like protein [Tetrahymena thermophila SB210]|eukprot:XP_001032009.2 colon cancer-associated Mic1-like protein [Tetrahymena thermophila SB210]
MDSINGAIYCKEQPLFEEYFPKKDFFQIFYNKGTRCMIFRQKKTVFQISIDNQNISKMNIPYEGPIYDLQIHKKERYMAYSIAHNLLSIVHLKGQEGKENKLKTSKDDKMDPIIHFEWIYGSQRNVDFVLCKQSGVVLYKLDHDKHQLKEQKIINLDISACWFDPFNEVLCCANNYEDGKIYPFYFNEKRQSFKYRGVDFKVESSKKDQGVEKTKSQSSSVINFFTKQLNKLQSKFDIVNFVTIGDNRNKELTLIPRDPDVCHKISLVVLYGKTFLAYLNPYYNKIFLYQLSYEKVTLCEFNLVSPSETGIRFSVADNLLIIHSTTENLSLVYDVRSRTSVYQIGPPQCLEIRQDRNFSRKNTIVLAMLKSRNEQEDDEEDEEEQTVENERYAQSVKEDPRLSEQINNQQGNQLTGKVYRQTENPQLLSQNSHHNEHYNNQHNQQQHHHHHSNNSNKSGRKQSAAVRAVKHPDLSKQTSNQESIQSNKINQKTQQNNDYISYQTQDSTSTNIFDDIKQPQQNDLMNKSVEVNILDQESKDISALNNINDESHFNLSPQRKKQSLLLEEDIAAQDEQTNQAQQQYQTNQFNFIDQSREISYISNQNLNNESNSKNQQQNENDTFEKDLDLLNFNTTNLQTTNEQTEKVWDSLVQADPKYKQSNYNIFDQTGTESIGQQSQNNNPIDLLDDDHSNQNIQSKMVQSQIISSQQPDQIYSEQDYVELTEKPENYLKIENKGQIYQLDKNVFTEDELIINCKERKFCTILVDINRIEKLATDEIEGFNVIIRRANSKQYGLQHLRQLFLKNKDIRYFGQVFNQILSNYKKKYSSKTKNKPYEVIDTGDLYYLFFLHLYTNQQTNKSYLTDILSEYIKQSTELEIPVESKFQNLLAKLLIEQQKFNTFLFFVQYRIITDNEDLAQILISMNSNTVFKQGFQLGLDMLYRLKKYYIIINILLRRGLFQQALDFMRKNTVNKINLKEMIKILLSQNGDMKIQSIIEYFREIISKSRGNEKFGFTYQDFLDELSFQQQQNKYQQMYNQVDLI